MRTLVLLLALVSASAADPAFTIVIQTDAGVPGSGQSGNNQFTLPLNSIYAGTYNCTVSWGDGTSSTIIASAASQTHTYASIGVYSIQITENVVGGFPAICFDGMGDCQKVQQLSNWGAVTWMSFNNAFNGCQNMTITATDQGTANCGTVTDFANAWRMCVSMTSFPALNTGGGTSFDGTWASCSGLTSFPLLDTSHGTNFDSAWIGCSGLSSFPALNFSAGIEFDAAWESCTGLTSFPAVDTSSATVLEEAWGSCSGLTSFPLLDTSHVTNVDFAWFGCSGLTSFPTLDLGSMVDGLGCFEGDTLTTASYSGLLVAMADENTNQGVTFNGGYSEYNSGAAATARNTTLIAGLGWSISDGGPAPVPQLPFTMVINTNPAPSSSPFPEPPTPQSGPNQFTLPLDGNYTYDCTVAWGDGTNSTITGSASPTHTYASAGTYFVEINENVVGGFPAIQFDGSGDCLKLFEIANWGDVTWSSFNDAFTGCLNMTITATDEATANTGNVSDFSGAWAYCQSMTSFPLIDTSSGTDFNTAWESCQSMTSFPLIDTSHGTDFGGAWDGCSGLTSFPAINTGSGTNFQGSWESCVGLSSFPILDTSAGTDFDEAWSSCSGLTSFPPLDTGNGTSFVQTWELIPALSSFPALNLDSMQDGTRCFEGDALSSTSYDGLLLALASGNLNTGVTFDGGGSQYTAGAAATARDTTLIADRGWTITDGGEYQPPFALVINTSPGPSLSPFPGPGIAQSGPEQFTLPLNAAFPYNCTVAWGDGTTSVLTTSASPTHTYPAPGTYTVEITENVLGSFPAIYFDATGDCLKLLHIANWGALTWASFNNAFCGCVNMTITAADEATAQTGGVRDFSGAWAYCTSMTSFPAIDTSGGTDFDIAWETCNGLTSFPLIDTSHGTDFGGAWNGCSGLTSFPAIDTSSGTDFDGAWEACGGLSSFPAIDTSSGTDFDLAWADCAGLTSFPAIDTSHGASFEQAWAFSTGLFNFPALSLASMQNGALCFEGDTLSSTSYSNLLIAMAAGDLNTDVTFDGGYSQYTAGAAASARNTTLISGRGWTITDGGETGLAQSPLTLTINTDPGPSPFVPSGGLPQSASNQFTLPLNSAYAYDCTVDWGDGTTSVITTSTSPTHSYSVAGTYSVSISQNTPGGFPAIFFDGGGDCLKLEQIANWGSVSWSTLNNAFAGCANMTITATDAATADTGGVSDFTDAWQQCVSLNSFPVLDTSAGTSFNQAWFGCSGLTSFPALDTSNGTDFGGSWTGCSGLTSFPLLNTGKGTSFEDSWEGCIALTAFPALDTGSGMSFVGAWEACSGLTSFPALDTSKGTNFEDAWIDCSALSDFPALNLASMQNGIECFHGDTLSSDAYSGLLIAMAADDMNPGVTFDGGNSQYSAGAAAAARNDTLIAGLGWTITDGGPIASAPSITSAESASGTVGLTFGYQITASNSPTSFAAQGLPLGLSIDPSTGAISGSPVAAGLSLVAISATNAAGTGTASLQLYVAAVSAYAPVITLSQTRIGTVGLAYSYQIVASSRPTSFMATGLPSGLYVDDSTGLISGIPLVAGTSQVNLYATNAWGTGTATVVFEINPANSPGGGGTLGGCGMGGSAAAIAFLTLGLMLRSSRSRIPGRRHDSASRRRGGHAKE